MGFGDEIMATGMARGARARGKRIAFGDGRRIIWGPWSEAMFRNNPNIARPGDEGADDLEWIAHHKGNRLYNRLSADRQRWKWNMEFRPAPGELFFDERESKFADGLGRGFVVIEPNVPMHKSIALNKDWGAAKYLQVAQALARDGHSIVQFVYKEARTRIPEARQIEAPDFRHALAGLARAALYIGPEGGMHHGAAAVGVPAVVLFGGFIPPDVTGYPTHTNLNGNSIACGKLKTCDHCRRVMDSIGVNTVLAAARRLAAAVVAA